jgi:hypothetical protein
VLAGHKLGLSVEDALWIADENLGVSQTDVSERMSNRHTPIVVSLVEILRQHSRTVLRRAIVRWPCCWTERLVALQIDLIRTTISESSTTHTEILHQSKVLDLVAHKLIIKHSRLLIVVGLDASHIGGRLGRQNVNQCIHTRLELGASRDGALLGVKLGRWKAGTHNRIVTAAQDLLEIAEKKIIVLVDKPLAVVGDDACRVNPAEQKESQPA